MRISAKGRYGLAAMIYLAQNHEKSESITVIHISDKLGISKIYLEQVFSLLKRSGLVTSVKGSQGGYLLSRSPSKINMYEALSAVETTLFETTDKNLIQKAPENEAAMQKLIFDQVDGAMESVLERITLSDLAQEAMMQASGADPMYFI